MPGAGDPRAWDRYSYVKNSPVVYNDPSGHNPMIWYYIGLAVYVIGTQIVEQISNYYVWESQQEPFVPQRTGYPTKTSTPQPLSIQAAPTLTPKPTPTATLRPTATTDPITQLENVYNNLFGPSFAPGIGESFIEPVFPGWGKLTDFAGSLLWYAKEAIKYQPEVCLATSEPNPTSSPTVTNTPTKTSSPFRTPTSLYRTPVEVSGSSTPLPTLTLR